MAAEVKANRARWSRATIRSSSRLQFVSFWPTISAANKPTHGEQEIQPASAAQFHRGTGLIAGPNSQRQVSPAESGGQEAPRDRPTDADTADRTPRMPLPAPDLNPGMRRPQAVAASVSGNAPHLRDARYC
jgi:hypothetical protein